MRHVYATMISIRKEHPCNDGIWVPHSPKGHGQKEEGRYFDDYLQNGQTINEEY